MNSPAGGEANFVPGRTLRLVGRSLVLVRLPKLCRLDPIIVRLRFILSAKNI